jgi:hypothetical protein
VLEGCEFDSAIAEDGVVTPTNLTGLILAALVTALLVIAMIFPDRF